MECRSENVTQGPPPTGLRFVMSPAGPASRRGFRAIRLGVVARPGGAAAANAATSRGPCADCSVAARRGSRSGCSSHLISFPRSPPRDGVLCARTPPASPPIQPATVLRAVSPRELCDVSVRRQSLCPRGCCVRFFNLLRELRLVACPW